MRKIMIVDDNYLSAEGIEKNIDWEVLNAEIVHICYNGTSAIEAMKNEPVDLIISDIEMPDLDGISMSRQALDINPMVKIILISAYDKFEYARRALLLGALDYIEKPLDSLNVVVIESRITSFEDVTNGIIFIKGIADRFPQVDLGNKTFPEDISLHFPNKTCKVSGAYDCL